MNKILGLIGLSTLMLFANLAKADGSFVGLGVVLQEENKSILIVDVYENSPALRAGIIPGEWITAVDGKSTDNKKLKEVTTWLKGDEGTKVTLTIKDAKREKDRDVVVTRELVTYKCFIEGQVNINFYSYGQPSTGTLSGSIGGV